MVLTAGKPPLLTGTDSFLLTGARSGSIQTGSFFSVAGALPMRTLAFRHMAAALLFISLCLVPGVSRAGQGGVPLDPAPTFVAFTPASVAADPQDETFWVADRYLPRIAHLAHDGSLVSVFSASIYGGGPPFGLTFEGGGTGDYLYGSDPGFGRLARIDRLGNPFGWVSTVSLGISSPAGLAWDPSDGT